MTHALRFVENCDRIAVIKNKKICELDTPFNLRQKKDSEFNILNMTDGVDSKDFDDYEAFNKRNQARKSALFNSKPDIKEND